MARSKGRLYACIALIVLFCVIVVSVCISQFTRRGCPKDSFSHGAVAADTGTCSQIGRDMLQKGGSAVDGAIAALVCTSLLNPQSMSLGGGAIFTVMDSAGKVKIINARERVPGKYNADTLKSCPNPPRFVAVAPSPTGVWIGIPGELRGYEEAHRLYGKLPWATLFQPSIKLARQGFPIPKILGQYLPLIPSNESQPLRELFSDENGNLLQTGDIVKFEKLADTLETIAKRGADVFYIGKIAEDLVRDIQEAGGAVTLEDLASYRTTVSDAWTIPLGEYQMYSAPPPGGGNILNFILNIMKGYDLKPTSLRGEQKSLFYHRYIEALKFANGLKKYSNDPVYSANITKYSFADHIRSLISDKMSHEPQYYDMTPFLESMGTTHVSVLAQDGSAVSVTSSINHLFGSRVLSTSTGVILNSQLCDFCERVDRLVAGDQPPSSMAPTVLKSKSKVLVIGSTGGSMITTGMASAIMNNLWLGKSLKEAIAAPVLYVDSENAVKFESNFDKDVIEDLKTLGQIHKPTRKFFNVVNAVEKEGGCISAVSDARKMGKAVGY
ncbi:gamma-glutamyltransferase 5a [Corythoichthys intestinalis]|uniref:gamma-glutamyltransferase 5a n=1 Tax=Corythoichthys intestinalis TaxID=161448 RepID=UPI0025A5113A|nr:gamma-glutamyltransferase 5a [Corythoichthys intestinalis]XP_057687567.1 gamma-glutamyltransferase 5a [Corythoichthys intestinalis]